MLKLAIEAPWYTFNKMVKAMFSDDTDIVVGDIYETDGETDYAFDIEVRKHKKFVALDRLLPGVKTFGNVTLGIVLFDEENDETQNTVDLFKTVFTNNPIVANIATKSDPAGREYAYVLFRNEVIQFFDDDISDYNGNWSGLAEDIAREVFAENSRGVNFCTAPKDKPVKSFGE